MKLPSERPSLLAAALLAAALGACLATPGKAQPPSCSWGSSGVVLAGAELRTLRLVGDGGAGVVAISVPTTGDDPGFPMHSSLRLHHVLEQGWLDPNLPPGGATFFRTGTGSDPDPYPRSEILQVAADGAGGAYVLVKLCNPNQPHLRCYEVATMRLLHAGADGAMYPGWPTAGITVPGSYSYLNSGVALGIVGDAQGGVILARLDVVPGATSNSLLVQRYGPGGTTSWPGGDQGVEAIAPTFNRLKLRLASDHSGGAAVVVTTPTATAGRTDLLATRVLANGTLPWGTAGRIVVQQPTSAAGVDDVTMDGAGRVFVAAALAPLSGTGPRLLCTQLLSPSGARQWGIGGTVLGPLGAVASMTTVAGGFVSQHVDGAGVRFQLQDETGTPVWGSGSQGVAAQWSDPGLPLPPLTTPDGHVVSVWAAPGAPPSTFVRAMELDEAGQPVAGWPAAGFAVCGGLSGHLLADAIADRGNVFVAFGAAEFSTVAPALQRLSREALAVAPSAPGRPLELEAPRPNPSRGAWSVRFAIGEAASVTLAVFDVGGRRVLERELGGFAPGAHVASADGAASLPPGLYRVRLRAGPHTAERMLVRLR